MAKRPRVNNGDGERVETERRLKQHARAMATSDKTYRVPGVVSTHVPSEESRSISPGHYAQRQRERGWQQ